MTSDQGSERNLSRRHFALTGANFAFLPLIAPHLLTRAEDDELSVELVENTTLSLPGGGERTRSALKFDVPGHFAGVTRVVRDEWEIDNGRIVLFEWHTAPAMPAYDGTEVSHMRLKSTYEYGEVIDEEFREVTITLEASAPGAQPMTKTVKGRERIVPLEHDPEEGIRRAVEALREGVSWQDAIDGAFKKDFFADQSR